MDKKGPPDWLELSLKRPFDGYRDHFGRVPIPPTVVKFAGSFGGIDAINGLLNEHVLRDEPVEDWDAFVEELIRRKKWAVGK